MKDKQSGGALVLKLGGSLIEGGHIREWLFSVKRIAASRCVLLVAGGGSLADAVRAQQVKLDYGDSTAHRMAILAMQQNACLLHDLMHEILATPDAQTSNSISLTTVRTRQECEQVAVRPGVAVWLPDRMTANNRQLETTWCLTSDSLAAWLATEIRAPHLAIAKSVGADESMTNDATLLASNGLIDPLCPAYLQAFAGNWRIVSDPHAFGYPG